MSIYIGNDLEDRLEALEMENASLRKHNSCRLWHGSRVLILKIEKSQ